jgi:hypothetical protein
MALANKKMRENIAEYLLFLWQMEDLVRAAKFDPGAINSFILSYVPDQQHFEEEQKWFSELMDKMKRAGARDKGHIEDAVEIMNELNLLHHMCLNVFRDAQYIGLYKTAKPNLDELREKSGGKNASDPEIGLQGLYGILLLKLKKTPISSETQVAMKTISDWLASLAKMYSRMKSGEMNMHLN